MAIKYIVREIERLSQEKGLNDIEIADEMGCSRATVNRTRIAEGIPKANLNNKKDKAYVCLNCKATILIKRKEVMKLYCDSCEQEMLDKERDESITKVIATE